MKSCSSILGSRDFKSIRRIVLPFTEPTYFAIALSTSKHPTSRTFISFTISAILCCLSHWTRTFDESPPWRGSWPLEEACWYTARGIDGKEVDDFRSVWRVWIALRRGSLGWVSWVRGLFRRMVVRWEPIQGIGEVFVDGRSAREIFEN
jgi:hypothetical protein